MHACMCVHVCVCVQYDAIDSTSYGLLFTVPRRADLASDNELAGLIVASSPTVFAVDHDADASTSDVLLYTAAESESTVANSEGM